MSVRAATRALQALRSLGARYYMHASRERPDTSSLPAPRCRRRPPWPQATVVYAHDGERFEVHSLPTARDAALVKQALAAKAQLERQRGVQRSLRHLALGWSADCAR